MRLLGIELVEVEDGWRYVATGPDLQVPDTGFITKPFGLRLIWSLFDDHGISLCTQSPRGLVRVVAGALIGKAETLHRWRLIEFLSLHIN